MGLVFRTEVKDVRQTTGWLSYGVSPARCWTVRRRHARNPGTCLLVLRPRAAERRLTYLWRADIQASLGVGGRSFRRPRSGKHSVKVLCKDRRDATLVVQDRVFLYSQPALFGELAIMLWLVIKGATPPLLASVSPGA